MIPGEPLPPASLRASFHAEVPATTVVDEVFILPCRVTNAGDAVFVSAPPNPIQLCYRWFDASGTPVGAGEWIHTPLPHALPPGETTNAACRIAAPHVPGTYTLAVTLLQEGIAWFDDLSQASGVRGTVTVEGVRASDIERHHPLTPLQQGMLFNSIADVRPGVEIEQITCAFRETLDPARFRQAWALLVQRHSILRTRFRWRDVEQPRQEVLRDAPLRWEDFDWSQLSADERAVRWRELVAAAWLEGFDLAATPPMRFALVRDGPADYRFCWTHHHALMDARAYLLLLNEVITTYDALARGQSPDAKAPRPFGEHAEWMNLQDWSRSEGFWRSRLRGMDAPTPLPIMLARSRVVPDDGLHGDQQLALSPATLVALRAFARSCDVTMTTLVLAAWATLLSRYSGTSDVMFGAVRAGRRSAGFAADDVVGPFITTIPIRLKVPAETRLRSWLADLRQQWVAARPHEQVPLATIQAWSDVPHGRPLFTTLVNVQDPPWDTALGRQGGRWDQLELGINSHPSYPLALDVSAGVDLRLRVFYDRRRLEDDVAGRVLGHTATILEAMMSHADRPAASLPLLTPSEGEQIVERNRATRPRPRHHSIHELFDAQAARRPGARAVTFDTNTLTYAELGRRAGRLASRLVAHGVRRGTLIGICAERSIEAVVGLLAILKAGGAYVPLDPTYPKDRLRLMVADAGLSLVLTQARWRTRLPDTGLTVVDLSADEREPGPDASLPTDIAADDRAYVIYTSGSTGIPKGVIVPHRAVVRLVVDTDYVQLGSGDRIAHASNLSFDAATFELWGALLTGAELVVIDQDTLLSPADLGRHLARHGTTTLFLTTALFNLHAREAAGLFRGLKTVLFGGERADPKSVQEVLRTDPPERLLHVYGPTETTTFATWFEVTRVEPDAIQVPIGRALANTGTYVMDTSGQPSPAGVPGELWIGGDAVATGYLNRPELTAASFVPDPFARDPAARCYRTGDLVRARADGHLEFLERLDHQVKLRGFRVEPGEIESALMDAPAVHAAVAMVREDAPGDRRLVAYVAASALDFDGERLRRALSDRLPPFMIPSAIVRLDALPLTPHGKIDRRQLPRPAETSRLSTERPPETPVEQCLAGIWAATLGVEQVGLDDSFLALGGDSLMAVRVVGHVNKAFTLALPVSALLQRPTLAEFAATVESLRTAAFGLSRPPVTRVLDDGPQPLSLYQERIWHHSTHAADPRQFVITMAFEILGPLNAGALERALQELMHRHEVLRTGISIVDGTPVQVVQPVEPLEFPIIDLSDHPDPDQEAKRLVLDDPDRPFDLRSGPLARFQLFRLGAGRNILVLTFHHLVYDATLRWVLFTELEQLYEAFDHGRPNPLEAPIYRYVDFAVWQRRWLDRSGEAYRGHAEYWTQRLGPPPQPMRFPFSRTMPPGPEIEPGLITLPRIPPAAHQGLKALGRAHGATLFMTLFAALNGWLAHLTGSEDTIVGTNVNQQDLPELRGVVGITTNLVALRSDVSGNPTFLELLDRVREAVLDAFAHQEMPFEEVLAALQVAQQVPPPIQVIFQLTQVRRSIIRLPGTEVSRVLPSRKSMPWGLTVTLIEIDDQHLDAHVVFDSTLYLPDLLGPAAAGYRTMLQRVADDPDKRLSEYFV